MNSIEAFSTPIPIFKPLLPSLDRVFSQLSEIWDSKQVTNQGPKQRLLEERLKAILEVPQLSLINNGTIALMLAIKALRLTGEVITTPFTFIATIHSLMWNQVTPVFCDIDPETMTLDVNKIEELITTKTTGILPVHVYGIPCAVEKIEDIAHRHHLKVIYDAAHAFGTKINDVGIGNFGDITMFSCHATKLYNTIEGGILTYSDPQLKEKVDRLRNFGIINEEGVDEVGLNGKLNEIQAAIGLINCNLIEEEREKRKVIKSIYDRELKEIKGIGLAKFPDHVTQSLQYYPIRINQNLCGVSRDAVYLKLKEYNVFTRKYFYPLCSQFDCYKHLPSADSQNLPVAHKIASEILCLPIYGDLLPNHAEMICKIIKVTVNSQAQKKL